MQKKYNSDFLDVAEALFKKGNNLKETSHILGCNPRVLSNFLRLRGVNTIVGRSHTAVNRVDALPENEIIKLYNSGHSLHILSCRFHVSRGALKRILLEKGLVLRSRPEANSMRWKNANAEDRRSLAAQAARNIPIKK